MGQLALFALASCLSADADWSQFRGPDQACIAADAKLPTKWSKTENIAWKSELPGRGVSGPIVIGDKVFITASRGGYRDDRLYALAFDAKTGKKLWERQFRATGRTSCHPKMCMATPTPAGDAKHFVAFYSCNDVACFSPDGDLLWFRGLNHDYPGASNTVGMSSSPVIVGNTVVVQVETQDDSFAAGLDLDTGVNRWRIARPKESLWASTLAVHRDGKPDLVLLQSSSKLTANDPATGEEKWQYTAKCHPIVTSLVTNDRIFVPVMGAGLTALRSDVVSKAPEVLWKSRDLFPSTPSPVALGSRLYTIGGPGILTCADVENGGVKWKLRLKGPFSSTPVIAGGMIYAFNEAGVCHVVNPGEKEGKIVSANELGETILCTPAIAGNALFVRSDQHLWKIAASR